MAKKDKTKFITKDILRSSILGAFQKLDLRYMIKNPVMFVVEIGFLFTLVLTVFPTLFGGSEEYRVYNGVVTVVLFVTVLFANFAESVAEGRGKAQAASLKKTKHDISFFQFRSIDHFLFSICQKQSCFCILLCLFQRSCLCLSSSFCNGLCKVCK